MKKNATLPRKIFHKIFRGGYCDNEEFIAYLRKCGIKIGSHCTFYDCNKVSIDTQNPGMLEIGDYVRITDGVQILTHDYSFSVLCSVEGDIVGSVEKVTIGNNVFIGRNAIILKGVHIGNNVIIGAGSIVAKDCKDNSVYAGNPAKRICSIEDMYKKRKDKMLENAKQVVHCYYQRYGKAPEQSILREYQLLFDDRSTVPSSLEALMADSGCYDKCMRYYKESSPQFENYEAFLKWCGFAEDGERIWQK